MCIAVYIGANRELPFIKVEDGTYTTFHVEIAHNAAEFQNILAASYIYYAGSFEGCGCGFKYESRAELEQQLTRTKDSEERKFIDIE